MIIHELEATIIQLTAPGKGILAADESTNTIAKRFANIHLESTADNRRKYRELLFTTPNINHFISGVILFEETLGQSSSSNQLFPELLSELGIVPGIKVDRGTTILPGTDNETITQGLDGLSERLATYKEMGARFAKWRAVLSIEAGLSDLAIHANAEALACYAAICQAHGIVPIVEPEVLMDGSHGIDVCAQATEKTLRAVFNALATHKVLLEGIVLKPNMVISGASCSNQGSIEQIADETLQVFYRTVPAAVPTINFLSGGQSSVAATAHLNAMNANKSNPWTVSFSYGRALQDDCLKTWLGKSENVKAAQAAFFKRAKLNSAAVKGQYSQAMETDATLAKV